MENRFDPMTGEPINPKPMRFDPMTGQPIGEAPMNFDPMTGQPLKPKKSKAGIIIGCIVAGVLVCAGAAFAVVKSGVFLSPQNKVLLATARTFSDDTHLTENIGQAGALFKDDCTENIQISANSMDIGLKIASGNKRIQLSSDVSGAATAEASVILQNSIAEINDEEVKLYMPSVSDQILTYNYKNEKNGFLAQQYGQQLDTVDEVLSSMMENKEQGKIKADLLSGFMKEWKNLDFTKTSKDTFTINGKSVKCGGYEVEITQDTVDSFVDVVEDVCTQYYGSEYQITDFFDGFREEYDTMPDMKVGFYIYKQKLACIRLEDEDTDEQVDICFEGVKVRWNTIKVKYEGDEVISFETQTSGSQERYTLTSEYEDIFDLSYDYKNGDYTFESADQTYQIDGNFTVSRKSAELNVDYLVLDDEYLDATGSVSVEQGASFESIKGDTFDIGEASETDIYSLVYGSIFN